MNEYSELLKNKCTLFANVSLSSVYLFDTQKGDIIYASHHEVYYDKELKHLMAEHNQGLGFDSELESQQHVIDFYQFEKSIIASAFQYETFVIFQFGVHKVDLDHIQSSSKDKPKFIKLASNSVHQKDPQSLSALTSHAKLLYGLFFPEFDLDALEFNYKIINKNAYKSAKKHRETIALQKNRLYKFISLDLYNELRRGISSGNISEIESLVNRFNFDEWDLLLTKNALRTMKYHAIIAATYCSNLMVGNNLSYDMSLDFLFKYIKAIDQSRSVFDVVNLIKEIPLESAIYVKEVIQEGKKSKSCKIIVEYIKENFQKEISMHDLILLTDLNPSYISRLIKKEIGLSFTELQHHYRVEKAKELLIAQNKSILEISMLCGFKTQSHFAKVFKSFTGVQPSKYGYFNYQ